MENGNEKGEKEMCVVRESDDFAFICMCVRYKYTDDRMRCSYMLHNHLMENDFE